MKDKHIIVLMGGPSAEAEVSRRTGAAIADALKKQRLSCIYIGVKSKNCIARY